MIINSTCAKFSLQTKENDFFFLFKFSIVNIILDGGGGGGGPQSHLDNWKRQTEVRPCDDSDKRKRRGGEDREKES